MDRAARFGGDRPGHRGRFPQDEIGAPGLAVVHERVKQGIVDHPVLETDHRGEVALQVVPGELFGWSVAPAVDRDLSPPTAFGEVGAPIVVAPQNVVPSQRHRREARRAHEGGRLGMPGDLDLMPRGSEGPRQGGDELDVAVLRIGDEKNAHLR
jgi:hypothetical protein